MTLSRPDRMAPDSNCVRITHTRPYQITSAVECVGVDSEGMPSHGSVLANG